MIPENLDPLETTLRKLTPRPMSAELRGRIAAGTCQSGNATANLVRGGIVTVVALSFVLISLSVTLRGPVPERRRATAQQETDRAEVGPALPAEELVPGQERREDPASRLTLHRLAEAETFEQIDAILDQCTPRWLVFTEAGQDRFPMPKL